MWWNAGGAGGNVATAGGKVQAPGADGAGRGRADKSRGRGRGKGNKAGGGVLPVALRRDAWILEVLVWRCRARPPNVLGSFLKFLMTARMLVASSLPRDMGIIRELNETVFALNFLKTRGIGRSETCERVVEMSLEVLILLSSFALTTPHHHCSKGNMAWDRLVSVGRMLTQFRCSGALGKMYQRSYRTSDCRCKESWSRCAQYTPCQRKCR